MLVVLDFLFFEMLVALGLTRWIQTRRGSGAPTNVALVHWNRHTGVRANDHTGR